jgi:hypothetical protein
MLGREPMSDHKVESVMEHRVESSALPDGRILISKFWGGLTSPSDSLFTEDEATKLRDALDKALKEKELVESSPGPDRK